MSQPASGRPRRVRVTHPRTTAARRAPTRAPAREVDEQTGLGEVYVGSLIRTQLRLAIGVLAASGILLAMLPALFVLSPSTSATRVLGLPLPWLLLGVLAYPALWVAARYYLRHAERNEAEFRDAMRRQEP